MTDGKGQRDTWEGNKVTLTSEELIKRLRSALRRDGDFPASAKIVNEIRQLTADPKTSANQITELILREPSLGVRVLHLVNSSFYRRAKPIMTVSQAVVQIGMRPLAEMCAGLVLLQRFVPAARRGGSFANCLRKTIVTSLLASALPAAGPSFTSAPRSSKSDEQGYLAGSFAELGTLLLAFYFPQIYEAALKRAEAKKQPIAQSIKDLTGITATQLSLEVIDALELPGFYKDILKAEEAVEQGRQPEAAVAKPEILRMAKSVAAAKDISEVVVENKGRQDLDKTLASIKDRFGFDVKAVGKAVGDLSDAFKSHCSSLDLQLPELPEYVMTFSADDRAGSAKQSSPADDENQFTQFVNEIRQAVESREPTASIITSVMETFAWSLGFDRVLLMLVTSGKTKLVGRLLLGNVPDFDPKHFERSLADGQPFAPDVVAIKEGRPVFKGEPLFKDGWPLAAIPIGFGVRAIGVIYADRTGSAANDLSAREQAAIGILAELLDRSLSLQS